MQQGMDLVRSFYFFFFLYPLVYFNIIRDNYFQNDESFYIII